MQAVYKRILLKLSGEALAGAAGFGLDFDVVYNIARCANLHRLGVEVGIVVGAVFGGAVKAAAWITRADHMVW